MTLPVPVLPSPGFPRDTVLTILQTISGVQVRWRSHKQPHMGQRGGTEHAWILASVSSILRIGVDELRMQYQPAPIDKNAQLLIGQRQATVTLEARSTDTNTEPYDLLERVAFRLRTRAARDLMVPTISLRDIQPIVSLPQIVVENRELLRASVDVRLNYVVQADPLEPDGGNYIGQVDGGGIIPGTLT